MALRVFTRTMQINQDRVYEKVKHDAEDEFISTTYLDAEHEIIPFLMDEIEMLRAKCKAYESVIDTPKATLFAMKDEIGVSIE